MSKVIAALVAGLFATAACAQSAPQPAPETRVNSQKTEGGSQQATIAAKAEEAKADVKAEAR